MTSPDPAPPPPDDPPPAPVPAWWREVLDAEEMPEFLRIPLLDDDPSP